MAQKKKKKRRKGKKKSGHVPLAILKKRLIKLSKVIQSRTS